MIRKTVERPAGRSMLIRYATLAITVLVAIIQPMKVREVIRLIEADGWRHVRTRGSHRQFNHRTKRIVAGKTER